MGKKGIIAAALLALGLRLAVLAGAEEPLARFVRTRWGDGNLVPCAAAVPAAQAAFRGVEEKGRLFRQRFAAQAAVVQAGLEALAGGEVQQEAGQQRFPGLA